MVPVSRMPTPGPSTPRIQDLLYTGQSGSTRGTCALTQTPWKRYAEDIIDSAEKRCSMLSADSQGPYGGSGREERRNAYRSSRSDAERPIIPLPAETFEDTEAMLSGERRKKQWVDDAYEEFVRKGGLDQLPGKGKPLVVPTGDILTTILKQANVPPPWVALRRELQLQMEQTLQLIEADGDPAQIDEALAAVNRLIAEMNSRSPSLALHRRKVTRDNIREQWERWR